MSGQVPYVSQSIGMTAADAQQVGTDQTVLASTANLIDGNKVVRVAASLTGASITGDGVVSGKLTVGSGATGLIFQGQVGALQSAVYPASVAPSASNYTILSANSGTVSALNSTTVTQLAVNNAGVVSVTSTGAAITGTLSSTGSITSLASITVGASASAGFALLSPGSSSITGYISFTTAAGVRQGYIGFSSTNSAQDTGTLNYIGGAHAFSGAISATTTIATGGYTVATLPAGSIGQCAYVTDATAPTFLGTLTGGGAVVTPVFRNATAWVAN